MNRIRNRSSKWFVAAFVGCAVVNIATMGCGNKSNQLVGRWNGPEGQMEFKSDGKCLISNGMFKVAGTYEVRENDTIRISTMGLAQDYKYEFNKGKLDLTNAAGIISEMEPMK